MPIIHLESQFNILVYSTFTIFLKSIGAKVDFFVMPFAMTTSLANIGSH